MERTFIDETETVGVRYSEVADTISLWPSEAESIRRDCLTTADKLWRTALHDEDLVYSAESLASRFPDRLHRTIRAFRDYGAEDGAILIEGLPVDDVAVTPRGPADEPEWTALPVASLVQLAVMSMLGAPISYAQEKAGKLIQDVYPKAGAERSQENSGSVLLELHTEDGFLMTPPDYLSLLCLRSDHELRAATVACGIRRVLHELPAAVQAVLRQPRFKISFSSSFVGTGAPRWTAPIPVLTGPDRDPDLCVDMHGMIAMDQQAEQALSQLRERLEANLVGGVLQRGSLLIIDNNAAVHGRTGFAPRYDGTDRWLRRCFVTTNLRRVRADIIQGRMLDSRERSMVSG